MRNELSRYQIEETKRKKYLQWNFTEKQEECWQKKYIWGERGEEKMQPIIADMRLIASRDREGSNQYALRKR
ncbi:hypothetical protein Y032_0327g2613 [Ancylostoma ceylanicum]|uniref:Uncharacterized protein n=1 Tax=Ancylostoma ceylanicum TaxID=53326 RepID=A0A016RZU5_9BILA|nr:hypothetical protein Y032_0327g2613 [Ancylostoma ceylanicum]